VHPIRGQVTSENMHARARGNIMMTASNDDHALLVSCGNKTEIALGYCTLYGDMAGGIALIGDVDKRGGAVNVYSLLRYVNDRYGREIIPEFEFSAKPSAELSPGQFDPFDYFVVSPLVNEFVDFKRGPKAVIERFRLGELDLALWTPDDDGKLVYDKHELGSFSHLTYDTFASLARSPYKRLQGPPIVKLGRSGATFGFDRREPIINGWNGGQRRPH
jgi:NAD+ synthase (glutamine-hydrolysing)